MIEWLMGIYKTYSEFTSSNQMLGAVIAGLLMSFMVIILRTVPEKLYKLLYNRFVSSVEFNSEEHWLQREACNVLLVWANNHKTIFYSRSSLPTLKGVQNDEQNNGIVLKLGIGKGNNLIWYKKRFYLVSVSLEKASETLRFNTSLKIMCLWIHAKALEDLLTDLFKEKEINSLSVFERSGDDWLKSNIPNRRIESVITTDHIAEKIIEECKIFIQDKDWYLKMGISYKLGIVLHGEPGTGKTSLVKAMATELDRSLYTLNIGLLSDTSFINAVRSIPRGSILSLEDIDCAKTTGKRTDKENKPKKDAMDEVFGLSLSTFLNVLDGVIPLNDVIVVMSTNHIDKIDPAILRKGRTDFSIEVKPLDSNAISRFSQLVYNKPVTFNGKIKGCDLQHLIIENKRDYEGFVRNLRKLEDITVLEDNVVKMSRHDERKLNQHNRLEMEIQS